MIDDYEYECDKGCGKWSQGYVDRFHNGFLESLEINHNLQVGLYYALGVSNPPASPWHKIRRIDESDTGTS